MTSLDERRRLFAKYKKDVHERGKPFFPYAMFHDTVMSLVVVATIVVLSVIWKFTTPGHHDTTEPGWLGKLYDDKADPGTTTFVPRPDWYFYFLFYLLRIFKWPDSVILGTVGIPTILIILMLAIPFVDRRTERRLLRRPVTIVATILVAISMGVLTYKGAAAKESLGVENLALVPAWAESQGFAGNAQAVAGAKIFAQVGCLNCHSYLGTGGGFAGAPDLSSEGAKKKGIQFQIDHLKNPSAVTPGSPMPSFLDLGEENLKKLALFLEASQGPK